MQSNSKLLEGSEYGDLRDLVQPVLNIDEYKSKMGEDEDICVIGFIVGGKEPADDLSNFIERGYAWVLDADVSAGEVDDGSYLVFIEAERAPSLAADIMVMMNDVMNLTGQTIEDWEVNYPKLEKSGMLSEKTLKKLVPLTPEKYLELFKDTADKDDLDNLKAAAGVDVDTKAPTNELTEYLRVAAGLK